MAARTMLVAVGLFLTAVPLAGCCATLPEFDTTDPQITLRAHVDGVDYYATETVRRDGVVYDDMPVNVYTDAEEVFVQWSVLDPGSIQAASLTGEPGTLRLARPSYVTKHEYPLNDALKYDGRRECPKQRLTVGVWVRPPSLDGGWVYLSAHASDWGGVAGEPNSDVAWLAINFDR